MSGAPIGWDATYSGEIPPWVIGHPQPAILALAETGRLHGTLLDIGCGTGEHTLLAAELGCDALGIDISSVAIQMARRSAAQRGIDARFQVMDAFEIVDLAQIFDVAIDSGHFHCVVAA